MSNLLRGRLMCLAGVAVAGTLALAGCGGSAATAGSRSTATASGAADPGKASTSKSKTARTRIAFKSPAASGRLIPVRYTCYGKDTPPPLEWGAVPSGAKEVAIFLTGYTPTESGKYAVSFEWGVAGIDPRLHRLAAGRLPAGAHVGHGTGGRKTYSICPLKGRNEIFQFLIYAVPATLAIPAKFEDKKVVDTLATPNTPKSSNAGGAFVVTYHP
jgi:phosphatidylethanolamine-binding protein (PEBP) family uncharacterized protein